MSELDYSPIASKTEPLGFLSTLQELSNEPPQFFVSELTLVESKNRLVKKLLDPVFRHTPNSKNMEEVYRSQSISLNEEEEVLNDMHIGKISSEHLKVFLSHFRNQMQDIYPVDKVSQTESESIVRQQLAQLLTRQALSYPKSHTLFKYLWESNTPGILSSIQSLDTEDIFTSNNIQKLTALMKDFLLRKCTTVYQFQEQIDGYVNDNLPNLSSDELRTLQFSIQGMKTVLYGAEQTQFLDAIVSLQKRAHIPYLGQSLEDLSTRTDASEKNTVSTASVNTSELSNPKEDIFKEEGKLFIKV